MPSNQRKSKTDHGIPFSPSAQTANAVKEVAVCTDCDKPRVIYASKKLSLTHLKNLQALLSVYSYSCGCVFQDLITADNSTPQINDLLKHVFVRANLVCSSPVEVPYFSSESFQDICYYCAASENLVNNIDSYPLCSACAVKYDKPLRRKRALTSVNDNKTKR